MSISRCIKLCLIALVVLLFACTSGEPIGFENQAARGVSLLTFANGDEFAQAAAQAPVALEINVLVDAIPALVVAAGGSARLANQVEIRLQEDGQWLDVTALYKSCWSDSSQFIDGKFTQSFTATLDQADEYLISARVEYFDGIVLQTDDLRSHLLTVTAPTEPEDGQPSGEEGFDEQDEWVIRDFTDPRDLSHL